MDIILNWIICIIKKSLIFIDDKVAVMYNFIVSSSGYFVEIIIGIFIFSVTILLGIDNESKENQILYKKKYIIMIYAIITLVSIVNRTKYDIGNAIIIIWTILLMNLISAVNISYGFGLLEKELSYRNLLCYSFWGWFFKTKTYICIMLILFLNIFNRYIDNINIFDLNYPLEIVSIFLMLTFFFFHIVSDMKDRFDYYGFDKISEELSKVNKYIYKSKTEPWNKVLEINDENLEIEDLLGLILYIEDRDFIYRIKPTYSIISVVKRKIKETKIKEPKVPNVEYTFSNEKEKKIRFKKIKLFLENSLRGYSTLQQQVTRKAIMKPYSYNYTIRRKIFVERIYNRNFVRAYRIRNIKNNGLRIKYINYLKGDNKRIFEKNKKLKHKDIDNKIKLLFLLYYYIIILKKPTNKDELISAMAKESSKNIFTLNNNFLTYNSSNFKINIKNELIKILNVEGN